MQQQHIPTYQISEANLLFVVLYEDEMQHTDATPFCSDLEGCSCHEDSNLVREYITVPLYQGLLTNAEAMRLYFGAQLVPSQDTRITDEEIVEVIRGDAENAEAGDFPETSRRDWLSGHL